MTLFRGGALGAALFASGFAVDAFVLAKWIHERLGPLHEPRRGILGLLLMALGAQVGLFAFLHALLKEHR